ncbi:hypothetical protein ACFY94_18110 [Streptomyces griseorubiginosus]
MGDGLVHASVPAAGGTGGFALSVHQQSPAQPWAGFEGCVISGGRPG